MMDAPNVGLVETGTANSASVRAAFARLGCQLRQINAPDDMVGLSHLILPGVGSFGAAMQRLQSRSLVKPIRRWIKDDRRLLAICVGMQLLFESSTESPAVQGLGVFKGRLECFQPAMDRTVPQMGWNRVRSSNSPGLVGDGAAYFANSYSVFDPPPDALCASSIYGQPFVAAVQRDGLLGCQFHPELSGQWGSDLLSRWLCGETDAEAQPAIDDVPTTSSRRIIPCLDVRDGRVVKGVKFQNLRDAGDPVQCARAYEQQGADELVILDVSATRENRGAALKTVRSVRRVLSIPLTVGGGVRSVDDAAALLLAGADKVAINTAATREPELIAAISERFGRQCTVVAIDAARGTPGWHVRTHAGTIDSGLDAVRWASQAESRGAGELLLTSFDRDGTGQGYDLDLLRAVTSAVSIPVIASGGAATDEHLVQALRAGVDAVLAATVFHDGRTTVRDLKQQLKQANVEVRTC